MYHTYQYSIVSCEAKKKQTVHDELVSNLQVRSTTLKLTISLNKLP